MRPAAPLRDGDLGGPNSPTRPLRMIVGLARAVAQAQADPAAIAEVTTRTLVGGYADGCSLHLVSKFQVTALAHRDAGAQEFLREVLAPLSISRLPASTVLEGGTPLFLAHVGPDVLDRCPPELRVYARRYAPRSLIVVPIRARGGIVGALSVWRDVTDAPFQDDDLATAHVCAEHVALALEHAAVFQELRDRQVRFELAARATQDLLWDWDLETNRIERNDALLTTFGWAPEHVRDVHEWWVEQIHPDDRERVLAGLHRAIQDNPTNQRWQDEYRFRCGDGRYAHVVDRAFFLRDGAGRLLRIVGSMQDVTERVEVALQLARREESYRAFIANSSEGIWCVEGDQGIPVDLPPDEQIDRCYETLRLVECNDAMARMYGYGRAEDIIGQPLDPLFPRADPRMLEYMRAFIASGYRIVDLETVERDRHGVEHYFLNNIVGTVEDGKLLRAWATQRDITDRARQAVALARYQLLSQHGRDIILFIRAATGEILEANDAAVAAYGYDRDELCTLRVEALRGPASRGELAERMAGADDEGVLYETEHRRKDGTTFPVEVSSRGADVDGERVILKIVRDITQRRRAETAAHRAGAILQAVLETSPDLVFAKDREGRFVFANPATFGALGRPPEDVLGRRDADFMGADAGGRIRANDLQVLTSGRPEFFEETVPSGRVFLSSKSPYRDISGAVVGLIGISMDITDRKQAELRLRRKQEALSLVMRAARVGTWMLDVGSDALWLSRELEEIFGLKHGPQVAGADGLYTAVHPDDRDLVAAEIRAAVAARRDFRVEFRFIRADDGEQGWMEARGRATYDESGRSTMLHGIGIDITERKRTELALRESEELFARAFGKNPTPMAVNSLPRGEYLEINEAVLRMSGYPREELLCRTPAELGIFDLPADVRRFQQLLDARASFRDVPFDIRTRGGRLLTILLSGELIEYRDRPCLLTVATDISDRKRAESALLESEERFRQIAATIDEAFWLVEFEPRWHYVYVSPWWRRIWDRNPEELYADPTVWARHVHPDDRADLAASQNDLAAGRVDARDIEYRLRRHDGSITWIRDRGMLIRGPDGEPWRAAGIAEDITERKLADRERERLVADLRVAIAVRDDFLSIASHELRTPLTALGFHLEHLVRLVERGERDAEVLARKVTAAVRQSDRVLALIDSLISVSRMSLDHLSLAPSEFDLVALVREILARLGPDAQRARCELRLDAPATLTGAWDRQQLDQVVHNLLTNALKYGAGQPIDVRVRVAGEEVEVEVEDRGIGIAGEDLPRIFDRFERAVSSLHYGGFGLGLYIARRMVEAHGGALSVTSVPGRGSTFRVRLPRIAVPQGTREP